jgi:hypothetical protein
LGIFTGRLEMACKIEQVDHSVPRLDCPLSKQDRAIMELERNEKGHALWHRRTEAKQIRPGCQSSSFTSRRICSTV